MTGPEPGIPANAHMLSQKGEHGIKVISEMMGEDYGAKLREAATSGKFGSDITRMAIDYSFADSWGREGLSRKEKSILIIGILLALKQPSELKNHVKIGAANGITVPEFESLLVQACSYVGFPCIASATTAVIEALREIGMDPDVKTAEERGLL
jgi:4-carboxymuconolactone decarboxylase